MPAKEEFHFYNEEKGKLVKNCSSCGAGFVINQGVACSLSCTEKQLEIKHREVSVKIIEHCLPHLWPKITIIFLSHLSAQAMFSGGWGWTDDITKTITIPWWTLRSKKEFLDTIIHELGHINAYEKIFSLKERNILEKVFLLEKKKEQTQINYDFEEFVIVNREIKNIYQKNGNLIDKYWKWEGHDYNPWYLECLELYQKVLTSPYIGYFYGQTKPRSHGFNERGEGEYDRLKILTKARWREK